MDRSTLEARTLDFGRDAHRYAAGLRPSVGRPSYATQLQRAASAIAANYRATARSRSRAEFVARMGVVNEEADEAVYWLEFIATATDDAVPSSLLQEARELRAIFARAYATARRNLKRKDQTSSGR